MARTQTGRDFGTNSRRKSTQQMYMCRLLPSSRIFRRCATNADCRLADLQTRRFVDLHFLWQGFGLILFILCLLLANRKVCLRQTTALAGCKHNSARFDRWLEILAVEDLTSEERWPKLQREQRRRRRVGSSSGFKTEGHLWAGTKSAQNLIVNEFL